MDRFDNFAYQTQLGLTSVLKPDSGKRFSLLLLVLSKPPSPADAGRVRDLPEILLSALA